jgi:hypothetical protein
MEGCDGVCRAKFCLEHYGHDLMEDMSKQALSDEFREQVVIRLKMSVPPQFVIADSRKEAWEKYKSGETHFPFSMKVIHFSKSFHL